MSAMSIATMEPQQCIARPPSPHYDADAAMVGVEGVATGKDFTERTIKSLKVSLGKLWRRRTVTITEYDPTYKCAYLGNVLTGWAKGEGCVEKPLSTLWKNYTSSSKPDVQMKVSVTHSGLKAVTKEHGLTEYWSHRVTYCAAPAAFPRIFCWVYRHEGRKLKQELRCHAVLCSKEAVAKRMATQLRSKLAQALHEFKRDKICRQNARLSLANSVYDNPSLPRRKILLSTGSHNYRPPLERSKSAPKLMAIEESLEEEEEVFESQKSPHNRFLLRINSVPLAREEMKNLSPQHISRLFQRVTVKPSEHALGGERDKDSDARFEEVFEGETSPAKTTEHVFDVTPVREEDLAEQEGMSERRCNKSPLVRRNSIKRVGWALEPDQRRHSLNAFHSERLLVLGKQEEEEFVKEVQDEMGESDENSLQSISSSGSDTSTCLKHHEPHRQYSLPLLYQDQRNVGCLTASQIMYQEQRNVGGTTASQIIYEELRRGIHGSQETYQEQNDERFVLENVVDLRPTGGKVNMNGVVGVLKRSVTFPPPTAAIEELDSLSDDDGEAGKDEEETESDESGYAELTEKEYVKPDVVDMQGKDGTHQIIKSILRPSNRNSQCVQV